MIRDESYIRIWWWMLNNLKLKWNELIVYATIYSFTNWTDDHCYKWSAGYLSERCWLQRRQTMNILKSLEQKWYIERKERTDNWVIFVDYYTPYAKIAQGGYANFAHHNNSFDNNSKPEIPEIPIIPDSNSLNSNTHSRDAKSGTRIPQLDIIKNSDDVRELFTEDEISQKNIQLKILLKMIDLWYKVKKSKAEVIKQFDWLKAKANLYNIKQADGNIAWMTFYQKIDKRYDWHTEKNKPVKNFKTSIVPFISK